MRLGSLIFFLYIYKKNKAMEQGLTFLTLILLLTIMLFVVKSSVMFLVTFTLGCTYLLLRGKRRGWVWPKRP